MKKLLASLLLLLMFAGSGYTQAQQTPTLRWWASSPTLKIPQDISPPATDAPLNLHAARQEYAPFQLVLQSEQPTLDLSSLSISYPQDYFEITVYSERYVPLGEAAASYPEIYSRVRLEWDAVPDGLLPISDNPQLSLDKTAVLWVDVYVKADTPPADYTLHISLDNAPTLDVLISVYPVDLAPNAAMNIVIPVDAAYEIAFYGGEHPSAYHRAVNDLLHEHDLVSGNFAFEPELTADGWDFYGMDAEIDALPMGTVFHLPSPYSSTEEAYLFPDENGQPYTVTNFEDAYFVAQLQAYYQALADYLRTKGRLADGVAYPSDESVWVADEPYHNGPEGFEHLAKWTAIIREAGLRLRASGVNPSSVGPLELGWLPAEDVADDLHVHIDSFDADPAAFLAWQNAGNQRSVSVYLNHYGDLIDMPAVIQRGVIWHVYGQGVRNIAGYAALEWLNEDWDLVDPWTEADTLYPHFTGYGIGALVWPGPLPSIRLKLLREGVEDARLLDLYGQFAGYDKAQALAACLTQGALADQNPADDVWDITHARLLDALSNGLILANDSCPAPFQFSERQVLLDMDTVGNELSDWELNGASASLIPNEDGQALDIHFSGATNEVGYYFGESDWTAWSALQVDLQSLSPYFSELDIGLSDANGSYILLRNGAIIVGPNSQRTLIMPLAFSVGYFKAFDWSRVVYMTISVGTESTQTNGYGERLTYPIGDRSMIFDNFALVR